MYMYIVSSPFVLPDKNRENISQRSVVEEKRLVQHIRFYEFIFKYHPTTVQIWINRTERADLKGTRSLDRSQIFFIQNDGSRPKKGRRLIV
jgi:hypothetical protein